MASTLKTQFASIGDKVREHAGSGLMFRRLFWWRVRHIAEAAYRLLSRRWHALVFVLFMLSPRDMPVFEQLRILAYPVQLLVTPGSPWVVLGTWMLMLALAYTWTQVQAEALSGGPAWRHLMSQPLPEPLIRRVEVAVLLMSDLPLLVPFAAAVAVLLRTDAWIHLPQVVAVMVAALQLPVFQWLGRGRPGGFLLLVGGQAVGLLLMATGFSPWSFALVAGATTLLSLRGRGSPGPSTATGNYKAPRRWLHTRATLSPSLHLAVFDLRALFDSTRTGRNLTLAALSVLPLMLPVYLRAHGVRPEVIAGLVLLSIVPLLFSVSGLVFDLRRLHAPMAPTHASFGISPARLRRVDLGVLQVLFLICGVPLVAAAWDCLGSWHVLLLLPVGQLAVLACSALNFRGDRGVLLLKLLVCAIAVATLIGGLQMGGIG